MTPEFYDLIDQCTVGVRKGPVTTTKQVGVLTVTQVDAMPSETELQPGIDIELIDVHFLKVAIDKVLANAGKDKLIEYLKDYPDPANLRLESGYIVVGGALGSQDYALRLFALGKFLGLWDLTTPGTLGIEGPLADQLAGSGYITISGYDVNGPSLSSHAASS